jgi:hypothetical protein
MQRRHSLEFAGRLGAGLGVALPHIGAETLQALPGADAKPAKRSGKPAQKAPTLAFTLDGKWLIATDPDMRIKSFLQQAKLRSTFWLS